VNNDGRVIGQQKAVPLQVTGGRANEAHIVIAGLVSFQKRTMSVMFVVGILACQRKRDIGAGKRAQKRQRRILPRMDAERHLHVG